MLDPQSLLKGVKSYSSDRVPRRNTTVAGFYGYVQTYIYLICSEHCNRHGNPRLSSLLAIVKGFETKTVSLPFRILSPSPSRSEISFVGVPKLT